MKKNIIAAIMCIILHGILMGGCASQDMVDVESLESTSSQYVFEGGGKLPEQTPIPTIESDELEAIKASKEAVITVGVTVTHSDDIYKSVNSFNNAQEKYWVEIKEYDRLTEMLLELTRGQGPDVYFADGMSYVLLAQNGVFEDLTPYFENSESVNKEDVVSSIWCAGCVDDGMFFVIPQFMPIVMVVEKGYTDNGAWTTEEYFALSEKYPEAMLSSNVTIPELVLINDLALSLDSYVDWDEKKCSFDSEEFIELLKRIKINKNKKYESLVEYSIAEQMQHNKLLTQYVYLSWFDYMLTYKDIRDALLEFCEIAGVPNEEGELKYYMKYDEFYAMSAASSNKEAAWSFFEYILSEEYQTLLHNEGMPQRGMYPANRNVLINALDAEIGKVPEGKMLHTNKYIQEKVVGVSEFTEEDKQFLLDIVENCYCGKLLGAVEMSVILTEELDYFFEGSKSAEEVAKVLQNRMSLYLLESQ